VIYDVHINTGPFLTTNLCYEYILSEDEFHADHQKSQKSISISTPSSTPTLCTFSHFPLTFRYSLLPNQ